MSAAHELVSSPQSEMYTFSKYINTAITLNKQMLALNQTSFFLISFSKFA